VPEVFTDGNRAWIAENLLLDVPVDAISAAMTASGFAEAEVAREIDAALRSPYLGGANRLRNRVHKRDWILSIYRRQNRLRDGADAVPRRHRLSREEFFEEFCFQNRPVLITGMLDDWPALARWSFDYFRERCGDRDVEVQSGRESDENYEINNPQHKKLMRFADYVDLIERGEPTNDFYITANNGSVNRTALAELWEDVTPIGEYLDAESPDTGFFWLGPAGTVTPFHHDLTNNFMAQVMGRKRVKLIPTWDTPFVYNHVHCYSMVDGREIDFERFPAMRHAQVIECVLEPGELLFVPIGWWHFVEGMDPSAMMSFTNFRSFNDFVSDYTSYNEM
jgi:hypothetical protein